MLRNHSFIFAICALLTGCQLESPVISNGPSLVIWGGTAFHISETETVKVFGTDTCPDSDLKDCVSLSSSSVEVFLEYRTGPFQFFPLIEEWHVERAGNKVALVRPNGFKAFQVSNN